MIAYKFKVDARIFEGLMKDLAILAREPVRIAVRRWQRLLEEKILAELNRKTLGKKYFTGELMNSVTVEEGSVSDNLITLDVTTDIPYAMIYEEESVAARTIRPRQAQFLTVPTPKAFVGGYGQKPKPLRSYRNTFIRPAGGKATYTVFEKSGGRAIPIYWLVREVILPYRPWLSNSMRLALPSFESILAETVAARIARAA